MFKIHTDHVQRQGEMIGHVTKRREAVGNGPLEENEPKQTISMEDTNAISYKAA
jgi:hypothetical protein